MRFSQFVKWCNERACDGRWKTSEAEYCIAVMSDIRSLPPWRREKAWKEKYEAAALELIAKGKQRCMSS